MKFAALALMTLCVAACSSSAPSSTPNTVSHSCTSNTHCNADEVCFYHDESFGTVVSHGSFPTWREGFCGKLEATR